jgi:ATP-binding cassette, subfamily B, bacterial
VKQAREFFYTFKEVVKIAAKVNKPLLVAVILINAFWGFSTLPGFYLQKLALDEIIKNIGNPNWESSLNYIVLLVVLRLLLGFLRSVVSGVSYYLRDIFSTGLDHYFERTVAEKLSELDIATIESPEFKDKFQKIEREGRRRLWGLLSPISDIPNYLVGFVSSILALMVLSPIMAIGVVLASIPEFLFSSRVVKKQYDLRTKLAPQYKVMGWLTYYLIRNKNFMELKLLNLAPFLTNKLKKLQDISYNEEASLGKEQEKFRSITIIPLTLLEIAASIWLVILTITEKITIGSFQFYLSAL